MTLYTVKKIDITDGETLAYRETESFKDVFLLLHGNMSSSVHFEELMDGLSDDFTVISLDLPGFGDSSYIKDRRRLKSYAEAVEQFLTAKKISYLTVLGWSTGGGVALELARLIPESIKQVYLLDSVGVKGFEMYKKDGNHQPIISERLSTRDEIAHDPVQVLPIITAYQNQDREFLKFVWNATIYNKKQPSDKQYDKYLDGMLKQRNLIDVDLSLVYFNITDDFNGVVQGDGGYKEIVCPITIIHGSEDLVVPLAESQRTNELFGEQSELIVFENCGHSILTDDLDNLLETIKETFKGGI